MELEDISELEALGKVVNRKDHKGGYLLTINLNDDKKSVAPSIVASYFGNRGIGVDEFLYLAKSRELSVRYRLPVLE